MITLFLDLKIELVKFIPEEDRYKLFIVSKAMRNAFNKEAIWNLILPAGYKDVSDPFSFYGRYRGFVRYIKQDMVRKKSFSLPAGEAKTKLINIDNNYFFNGNSFFRRVDHVNEQAKAIINNYPAAKIENSKDHLLVLVKNTLLKIWDSNGKQVLKRANVLMASLCNNKVAYVLEDRLYLYDLTFRVKKLLTKPNSGMTGDLYLSENKIVNNTCSDEAYIINFDGVIERKHPTPVQEDYLVTKIPGGLKVERLADFSLVTTFENENITKFKIKSEYLTIFYKQGITHVFNLKLNKRVYSAQFFPSIFRIHEYMFCLVDGSSCVFFSAISGEHLRIAQICDSDKSYLSNVAATRKGDILIELRVNDIHHYVLEEFKKPEGKCLIM